MTADVRGNSLEVVHPFQDRLVRREGQKRVRFRSHVKKEERFRYIEEAMEKERGCEGAGMRARREEDQGPWKQTRRRSALCLAKRHVQVNQQTACDDRKQGGLKEIAALEEVDETAVIQDIQSAMQRQL